MKADAQPRTETPSLPHVIIIGAQKSGTTYLGRCLDRHAELFVLRWENPFFGDPYYQKNSIEALTRCFADAKPGQVRVMKRPDYLSEECVPARIASDVPDVRLIAILRNPVKRAISAYYHFTLRNCFPWASAEVGLQHILNGEYDLQRYPVARWILEYGNYAAALERYDQFFESDRLKVLIWEHFIQDPARSLDDLCTYIGVRTNGEHMVLKDKEREGVYSPIRQRWLRFWDRLAVSHATDVFRRRLRYQAIVNFAHRVDNRVLLPLFGNQRPTLSRELLSRLYDYYAPDIEKLEKRLDIDLNMWRPDSARAVHRNHNASNGC